MRRRVWRLVVLLLLLLSAEADEETVKLRKAKDLSCTGGAVASDTSWGPRPKQENVGPGIRSGDPGGNSECVVVKPTTVKIERVSLDYGWVVGFDTAAPTLPADDDPVLSIWVQDTPGTGQAGGKKVYSKALKCDYEKGLHCYAKCEKKDSRDCFDPSNSVDVPCKDCTGKYISIRFTNNKRNLQMVLPIDIEINHVWAAPVSWAVDIAGLVAITCE